MKLRRLIFLISSKSEASARRAIAGVIVTDADVRITTTDVFGAVGQVFPRIGFVEKMNFLESFRALNRELSLSVLNWIF